MAELADVVALAVLEASVESVDLVASVELVAQAEIIGPTTRRIAAVRHIGTEPQQIGLAAALEVIRFRNAGPRPSNEPGGRVAISGAIVVLAAD